MNGGLIENTVQVIVADELSAYCTGLSEKLRKSGFVQKIHPALNIGEVIKILESNTCRAVLIDSNMPGNNGVSCTKAIKTVFPAVHVFALGSQTKESISYLLQCGVNGFLLKSAQPKEIRKAILTAAEGNIYYANDILEKLQPGFDYQKIYTQREWEVFMPLIQGKTPKEIADSIHISIDTVYDHRKSIFKKANVKNETQLLFYAVANKIATLQDIINWYNERT